MGMRESSVRNKMRTTRKITISASREWAATTAMVNSFINLGKLKKVNGKLMNFWEQKESEIMDI